MNVVTGLCFMFLIIPRVVYWSEGLNVLKLKSFPTIIHVFKFNFIHYRCCNLDLCVRHIDAESGLACGRPWFVKMRHVGDRNWKKIWYGLVTMWFDVFWIIWISCFCSIWLHTLILTMINWKFRSGSIVAFHLVSLYLHCSLCKLLDCTLLVK